MDQEVREQPGDVRSIPELVRSRRESAPEPPPPTPIKTLKTKAKKRKRENPRVLN